MIDTPVHPTEVALFTEAYAPLINGVVASIDALRAGLENARVGVTIVAPHFPRERDDDASIVRLPSLPLPTATGYRLCLPYMPAAVRARVRRAHVIHAHSPFVTGLLGANIARRYGIPFVFTYHTRIDEYAHYAPLEPRLARTAMTMLTRAFANRADAVIAPTVAMERRLREIGVRVPIAVVASSIDTERFANAPRDALTRAALGIREDARVVLAVSRLAKEKNLELTLDAFARMRDAQLVIAGDGPHRAALEARAIALGIRDRVRFTGAVAPSAMPAFYAASDAFAFASTTETQGLVSAEALAAGLPVVAVDTPVNREVLGGFGRLVPADAAAFGAALEAAVTAGRDAGDAGAVRFARTRFGRNVQAEAILEIYRSISLCRTFGTPVRDYAPGSESYR